VDEHDAEFLEKHADELTRFATAVVGPTDAPDVVSGAFLHCVVSRRWPTVSDRRAYLYRAVLSTGLPKGIAGVGPLSCPDPSTCFALAFKTRVPPSSGAPEGPLTFALLVYTK
jgi:hypothetical protein